MGIGGHSFLTDPCDIVSLEAAHPRAAGARLLGMAERGASLMLEPTRATAYAARRRAVTR